ncbi:MAG: GNA1162 family protein [Bacteroidota bacterium]
MRTTFILFLALSGMFAGCTQYVTKHEFAPDMYEERPLAVLVLPPINKSTAADAKEYYTTTIAEPLTNMGYYVFPIEVVNEVLKQEGLFDTETMFNVPPGKFKEYFGADAVMYVTILEWNTQYLVTSGSVNVKLASELRSTTTGEVLWFYDERVSVSTTGESGGATGLAGLLVQAITTAIKTAATDYVPLARDANAKILLALPYGKYNKGFGKDQNMKIEKKKQVKAGETK